MLRQLRVRLLAHFRRRATDAELDEELRYHLDREIDRNLARGLSSDEARHAARRAFGNPLLLREEARDTWRWTWLDDLTQDMRYAVRQLSANPGFAAATVLTLALSIGAVTMMYSVRRSETSAERRLLIPERLAYIGQGPAGCRACIGIASGNFVTVRDQARALERISMFADWEPVLRGTDGAELIDAARVTADFFRTLGIRAMLGRVLIPEDSASGRNQVVVLAESMWSTRFGRDTGILGRTIVLDRVPYSVVGVVPTGAAYPSEAQLWVPLVPTGEHVNERTTTRYRAIGWLREGVTVEAAAAEISGIGRRLASEFPESMSETHLQMAPLLDLHRNQRRADGAVDIFSAAVGLLLLIASINLAGLLIARLTARRRELALRRALGAAPSRITRQLVVETTMLTLLAGVAGLLLAIWGTPAIFGEALTLDARIFGVALGIGLLTGVSIGLWPAMRFARPRLVDELRESSRLATGDLGSARGRRALVIAQVAVAVVLLAAAGALARSFSNIYGVEPGFSMERVLAVRVWNALPAPGDTVDPQRFDRLVAAIAAVPGVEYAGATVGLPFGHGAGRGRFEIAGMQPADPEQRPSVHMQAATPDYFRALGIPVLRGRVFAEADGIHTPRVAVINEAFARRFFREQDPIGQGLLIDEARWEIVGIIGDAFHGDVELLARPEIYRPMRQWTRPTGWLAVRTRGNPALLAQSVVAAVSRVDPDLAITSLHTMPELRARDMGSERRMLRLMGAFALAAVLISAIGLYGLISYSAAQRTREFGIRLALGAQRGAVLRMVIRQGLRLTAVGACLGILGAFGGLRVMQSLLFGISPSDPLTLAGVIGLVGIVALIAAYLPARRAMLVDPVRSLKED